MIDYKEFSERLCKLVRPQSYPLGITLIKPGEQLPPEATKPSKYGIKISLCQWTTMARRWGRVLVATAEEINCTPCLAALGLKELEETDAFARFFMDMGYFESLELAKRATESLDLIPSGEIGGMVFFPLEMAPVEPHVVVIYGTPAQMARLAAGYAYHSGEFVESNTTGFGLSCLAAIKPYFTGKPALVHPGKGERMLAGTDECEMFFTIPADQCQALLDGLEKTQERGMRYPVPSYLLYQPPLIKPMRELGERLK